MSPNRILLTGGCYCGAVRYEGAGPPSFRGLCYCRTCQMISAGAGNLFIAVDAERFQSINGTPRSFTSEDHPSRPTRHFCEICVKVGTLDDPSFFEGPQM